MSELYLLTTIAERRKLPQFVSIYQEEGADVGFIALGHGTAASGAQGLLLDDTEKAVVFSVVTRQLWKSLKRQLQLKLQIEVPGTGIAAIVPLSSIGGRRELAFFTDGMDFTRGEESVMQGTKRELLVVVSEPGYNDMVMDAAREAGAYGGTLIHARGTGMEKAERFLGISLASEKDMTFIVVKTEQRDRIMSQIMMKAGLATSAKSIVFSLPVTDTAGLRLQDEEEEENEEKTEGQQEASQA